LATFTSAEVTPNVLRQAADVRFCVDLRGVLSNPEVLEVLERTAHAVAGSNVGVEPPVDRPDHRRWRIVDRIGPQAVRDLVRDGRSGITYNELALRYDISPSSVKRLLAQARNQRPVGGEVSAPGRSSRYRMARRDIE
jgi:DNA invertase Pin-like site-specific DNA recombinase